MDISHAVVLDAAWLLPVAAQQTRCIVRGQWAVDRVTLDILSPAATIIATTTTTTSESISPVPLSSSNGIGWQNTGDEVSIKQL
jgi:hypothetical protein